MKKGLCLAQPPLNKYSFQISTEPAFRQNPARQ